MPSLRQLLANHRLCLVIDTCANRAEAALWRASDSDQAARAGQLQAHAEASIEGEASAAMPAAVAKLLETAGGLRIRDLDAVTFCDGPGSVLGVRLAAATLRAWRSVHPAISLYSFHSLPLLAVAETACTTIIADARRDTWHAVRSTTPHQVLRIPTTELNTHGQLATPDNFRRWSLLPEGVTPRPVAYSAARLIAQAPDEPFFSAAAEPDAFMHEQPSYVAWSPRIHQSAEVSGAK